MRNRLERLLQELIRILALPNNRLVFEILEFNYANDGRVHLSIKVTSVKTGYFTIELSIDLRGNAVVGVNPGDDEQVDTNDPLVLGLVLDLRDTQNVLNELISNGLLDGI